MVDSLVDWCEHCAQRPAAPRHAELPAFYECVRRGASTLCYETLCVSLALPNDASAVVPLVKRSCTAALYCPRRFLSLPTALESCTLLLGGLIPPVFGHCTTPGNACILTTTDCEYSTHTQKSSLTCRDHSMVEDVSLTGTGLSVYILFLSLVLIDLHAVCLHERKRS